MVSNALKKLKVTKFNWKYDKPPEEFEKRIMKICMKYEEKIWLKKYI